MIGLRLLVCIPLFMFSFVGRTERYYSELKFEVNQLKRKLKTILRAVRSESDLKTINHLFEKQGP